LLFQHYFFVDKRWGLIEGAGGACAGSLLIRARIKRQEFPLLFRAGNFSIFREHHRLPLRSLQGYLERAAVFFLADLFE
jgi:hypothetical protein